MKRLLLLPVLVVAVVVAAGCEAESNPATSVGRLSATLHGEVGCNGVRTAGPGEAFFQLRGADPNIVSSWREIRQPNLPIGELNFDSLNGNTEGWNGRHSGCAEGQNAGPLPVSKEVDLIAGFTHHEFRICTDQDDGGTVCADADGTINGTNYDGFDRLTDPPPPPSLIPATAVPVSAGNQEWNGTPGSTFTTSQCPHAIPYMQDTDGSIFARFQRNPGEPQSAGGYRCEQQSSTYIQKGVYWFQWRARYPNGYEPSCASWCTMRQWHENTSDGGGPVYLATFMQNGRPQIDGQFVNPGTQTLDVDVRQWHTYTAQVNFQSNGTGWAELYIDGVLSGRTSTNTTATPSNSYDKYGTYGGDSNTTRTADYDWAHAYRMP